VFITNLFRIFLVVWIVSIVWRWIGRETGAGGPGKSTGNRQTAPKDTISDIPVHGDIEDADFEEIDDR